MSTENEILFSTEDEDRLLNDRTSSKTDRPWRPSLKHSRLVDIKW